jgi:four helix bundle protein
MKDFKELIVWRKAHSVTLAIYAATRVFPREELYGLTSQLRRSAASIGAKIAEGCGRRSDGEMCRFLNIAYGSATEVEYHLLLARDLHLLEEDLFRQLECDIDEVRRMLTSLIQRVRPLANTKKMPIREAAEKSIFIVAQSSPLEAAGR